MTTSTPTDTVVLVHGLWMTPRSWEHWVPYYEAKGYRVLTPAYPGFDIEVEALRENPGIIADLTVPETVEHLASVIEAHHTHRPYLVLIDQHGNRHALDHLRFRRGSSLHQILDERVRRRG